MLRDHLTITRLAVLTLLAATSPLSAQTIRLGDVTAGGDGTGTALPTSTGVDERNGGFITGYLDGPVFQGDTLDDGLNPSPVPASPYIDSVFFIAGEPLPGTGLVSQTITQSGVRFDSFRLTDATGWAWSYLLRDRNGGVSTPGVQVGGIAIPPAPPWASTPPWASPTTSTLSEPTTARTASAASRPSGAWTTAPRAT